MAVHADTLLQGVQGLIWIFHTLATRLHSDDSVRYGMESALDTADAMLAKSRDRVQDLRDGGGPRPGLIEQLTDVGDGMSMDHPASCSTSCLGVEREVKPMAQDELCDIVREALTNAFAHSGASTITIVISYGEQELSVTVSDNGCGIHASILESGKARHFGLVGMRERAEALDAALELDSKPSHGTRVCLRPKAELAYKQDTILPTAHPDR